MSVGVSRGGWVESLLRVISIQREKSLITYLHFIRVYVNWSSAFIHVGIFVCSQTREKREAAQLI